MIKIKKYDLFDNEIDNIWEKCKNKINKKCCKYNRFIENITSIWEEIEELIHDEIKSKS